MIHLDPFNKQQNPSVNIIILNNPETQQMNLDTRLVQLPCHSHGALSGGPQGCTWYPWSHVSLNKGFPAQDDG